MFVSGRNKNKIQANWNSKLAGCRIQKTCCILISVNEYSTFLLWSDVKQNQPVLVDWGLALQINSSNSIQVVSSQLGRENRTKGPFGCKSIRLTLVFSGETKFALPKYHSLS